MGAAVSVSVQLLLTTGEERIHVTGSGDRATVSFPSVTSGLRHLRGFLKRPELVERLGWFDSTLAYFGLSLYVKLGPFAFPLFGTQAKKAILAILSLLGRLETRRKNLPRARAH